MSMAISGLLISFEHYYIMLKDLKLAADNLEKAMSHAPLPYQDDSFTLEQYDVAFQRFASPMTTEKKCYITLALQLQKEV